MSEPDSNNERLWAVRGAAQAEANEAEAILSATRDLISGLLERNALNADQIVSVIFTCTDDLDAQFPAVAARELGLDEVPLMCGREMNVPGAMERVIRVMAHFYGPAGRRPEHYYAGATRALRSDLHAAQ